MKIKGVLKKYYTRDKENGWCEFGIDSDEILIGTCRQKDGLIRCKGRLPNWPLLTNFLLDGDIEKTRFIVKYIKPITETEKMSLLVLRNMKKKLEEENSEIKLTENAIKKIIKVAGPDVLSYAEEPDAKIRLREKEKFIKEETIDYVIDQLRVMTNSYEIVDYLAQFGCSLSGCTKLVELYGKTAKMQLRKFPYQIGFKAGLDFHIRDEIAKTEGIEPLDRQRIKSLIYTALNQKLESSGSTYVTINELERAIDRLRKNSAYPDTPIGRWIIAITLKEMSQLEVNEKNEKNEIRIYKKSFFEAEKNVAANLKRLSGCKKRRELPRRLIEQAEHKIGIHYSDEQQDAFKVIQTPGIKIITGGPGTGKTTLINGIIYAYENMNRDARILLCAPTGRASQRIAEVTDRKAKTIHKALEFRPFSKDKMIYKDKMDPIEANLIVVDEMSMVDIEIFNLLLDATQEETTVLLVGDEDQLQSVGCGNVLHDLIKSKKFEMYRLKKVFRQKGDNTIVDNAYRVLKGETSLIRNDTFSIYRASSIKEAAEKMYDDFMKNFDIHNPSENQILVPTKVGEEGTDELNSRIVNLLNPEEEEYYSSRNMHFHVGDRVIFLHNNYDKGYFNGDMGIVTEIMKNGFVVNNDGMSIKVSGETLQDVTLAYAITIHKSQGSEAPCVYILLTDTYQNMLNRNILFTAITRAKKKVHIYYVNSALSDCIHVTTKENRKTGLTTQIKEIYDAA